jgi:hypothetical protein
MRFRFVCMSAALVALAVVGHAQDKRGAQAPPEAFTSQIETRTGLAGVASNIRIQIDRYTGERDRKAITDGIKFGGYPGLVKALRAAPEIGHLAVGDEHFPLQWAKAESAGTGRTITLVADQPVYFIGGGRNNAKPREGFELAVVQLTVDEFGTGKGTMAAAARVKLDGQGGITVEDYAEAPIKLTFVRREMK